MAAVNCVGDYADLANAGNTNGKHRRRPIVLFFLFSFGFRRRNCDQILRKSDFWGLGGTNNVIE